MSQCTGAPARPGNQRFAKTARNKDSWQCKSRNCTRTLPQAQTHKGRQATYKPTRRYRGNPKAMKMWQGQGSAHNGSQTADIEQLSFRTRDQQTRSQAAGKRTGRFQTWLWLRPSTSPQPSAKRGVNCCLSSLAKFSWLHNGRLCRHLRGLPNTALPQPRSSGQKQQICAGPTCQLKQKQGGHCQIAAPLPILTSVSRAAATVRPISTDRKRRCHLVRCQRGTRGRGRPFFALWAQWPSLVDSARA